MKKLFIVVALVMPALSYSQVLRKPIPPNTVVLTFDDAAKSHFTLVAPLLKKYNFGATFFICEFPPDFNDTVKYMTWGQIKELSDWGFEIGNHTKNHERVDKMDEATLIKQLVYINDKCTSLHIPKPVSFAYPSSYIDPLAGSILMGQGFKIARAGERKAYDPEKDHPMYLPSFGTNRNDRDKFYNAVSQAKEGKVVVFTIHGVPDYAHDWVTTPPSLFEEYLKYLYEQKFNVIALRDLLPYLDLTKALQLPVPLNTKK